MTYLGIEIVGLEDISAFLERSAVSKWVYREPVDFDTASRRHLLLRAELDQLRRFRYTPKVCTGLDAAGKPFSRVVHTGSPYATNLIWATSPMGCKIHFLVVFESKVGVRGITANFPTGLIDNLESAAESAIRETAEEARLDSKVTDTGSAYVWASRHENQPNGLFHAYLTRASMAVYAKAPAPNRGEIVATAWLSAIDFIHMMKTGQPIRVEIDAVAALSFAAATDREIAAVYLKYLDSKYHYLDDRGKY